VKDGNLDGHIRVLIVNSFYVLGTKYAQKNSQKYHIH
jgi:hypothetical protein